ncbi:MAG: ATP-binding protein [Pseudomonadota bacterium]
MKFTKPKTPFQVALAINLMVAALVAVFGGFAAFMAIDSIVERTLKEEIRRDMAVLRERASERAILPEAASITVNISRRMFQEEDTDSYSVYLLVRKDRTVIIGNAVLWPDIAPRDAWWGEVDGRTLGLSPGAILVRTESIDGELGFLVGRRLTARQALITRFVPSLIFGVVLLGGLSSVLLIWLHSRYLQRVRAYNSAFHAVETGDLAARIPAELTRLPGDELAELGGNVNKALDEVQRLLAGLDAYSQVAAHELNLAVSHMRERFVEQKDVRSVEEADRLLDLVSHILELAKIEATPGFAMERASLKDVVQSVLTLFGEAFEEKGVALHRAVDAGDAVLFCSRPLIESAMANLLSNALKHAPVGSRVTVMVSRQKDQIVLSIQDEGPGVADTNIETLARLGRQSRTGGNGFGLRHVQAVAIRHGARLVLENTSPGLKTSLFFRRA